MSDQAIFSYNTGIGVYHCPNGCLRGGYEMPSNPKPKCAICGSTKTFGGGLCYYMCYWSLEGWLGWNARTKMAVVRDQRAMRFVVTRISYPKMLVMARAMGWKGDKEAGTFPVMAKAAKAGSI